MLPTLEVCIRSSKRVQIIASGHIFFTIVTMANQIDEKLAEVTPVEDVKASLHALQEAKEASDAEHSATFRQAMRENWRAALWSAVISLTIVMEGYDMALMSNFFGYPTFQRKFGAYVRTTHPEKHHF